MSLFRTWENEWVSYGRNNQLPRSDGQNWTYRGIRTPSRHRISKSPKGWSPSIYCNGFPLLLAWHMDLNRALHPRTCGLFAAFRCLDFESNGSAWAWLLSQRSSLRADTRSRHSRKRSGRRGSWRWARRRSFGGRRGMSVDFDDAHVWREKSPPDG